jgi:LuxR family transcriptional regulator, maltose regulon positive regulatory protein
LTDIIETKLNPPYIRHKRMKRTSIVKKLTQGIDTVNLVSVVAPAGSGKSTLLVELYEIYRLEGVSCAWLNLEPSDDDPTRFARYIISALRSIDKKFSERMLSYLTRNVSADLTSFFDSIIQYIAATDIPFALFVDDFDVLKNPGILAFWTQFISYAPVNARVVIASRSKISLDLSRHRISGRILELGQRDLNLNVPEIMQFMKEQHDVELPMQTVQLLHDRTEGWMVGLQLAGMTISKSDRNKEEIIRGFSARDRNLQEYLFETVYGLQDEATRYFLLRTSPLNRFSAELCDVVTDGKDGYDRLVQLEAANLFIIPLDREGRWYRYHHLFSEYLIAQLIRHEPDDKQEICELAADWCIREGYLLEAIQYCLDASYFEKATDLIAEHAKAVAMDAGNHTIIFEWMRKLPQKYHYRRPEILLHHAWSRAFSRDGVNSAVSICDEFENLLDDVSKTNWDLSVEEVQSFVHLSGVIRCVALACLEKIESCIVTSMALLAELPKDEYVLIASASVANGFCHYLQKNLDQSLSSANDAYVYGRRGESAYAAVWGDFVAVMSNVELGRIHAAEGFAHRAERTVGEVAGGSQVAALAALAKAEVECQRCEFERLEECLVGGRVISTISNSPEPLLIARCGEARYRMWIGEYSAAWQVLQRGQELAISMDMPRLYFAFIAEEIEMKLHIGRVSAARDTVRRTDFLNRESVLIDASHKTAALEYIDLTEVRLHLAENRGQEALTLINTVFINAQRSGRIGLMQHLNAMSSIALWQMGKEAEAIRKLENLISIAALEMHIYPLYRVGRGLIVILQRINNARLNDAGSDQQDEKRIFVQRLIELLSDDRALEKSNLDGMEELRPPVLAEPLTDRQMEILRLIGAGLANQDLAHELHISLSTAKWHVHNIFEKLGVRNRTSAVAYARKINLL